MIRFAPIVLAVVAIVVLTIPQIRMSDRFAGSNFSAEQKAKLLEDIPMKIGNWQGEDMKIDATVRETAGAVGAVSRVYRNSRTGDKVDLWLIVGHGRVISAHTPNICYQASGFEMRAPENSLYPMVFPGQPEAPFWTNTFSKEDYSGRRLIRVFWSWYNAESPDNEGKVVWEAPPNSRWHFGNTRALYKMYFTSEMKDSLETADESACLRFAREFMPVVNEALAEIHGGASPSTSDTDGAVGATTTDPATSKTTSAGSNGDGSSADPSTGLFGDSARSSDGSSTAGTRAEEPTAAAPTQ